MESHIPIDYFAFPTFFVSSTDTIYFVEVKLYGFLVLLINIRPIVNIIINNGVAIIRPAYFIV
jgi:hypothetical protein